MKGYDRNQGLSKFLTAMFRIIFSVIIFFAIALILLDHHKSSIAIHGPIVTLDNQATRSFKVQWLATEEVPFSYRQHGLDQWQDLEITTASFEAKDDIKVYRAAPSNLDPGRIYEFRIGESRYKVRTLPDDFTSLRFAVGGDMMHDRKMLAHTTRTLSLHRPDFAVLGGDLAYGNGVAAVRWYAFLDEWARSAITPEGLMVPAIVAIGNHEVRGGYRQKPEQAPYFYTLFKLPEGTSNYTVDIGNNLSLLVLDSNHTQSIAGQIKWLEKALSTRRDRPFLFPVYHYPAYGMLKQGLMNWKSVEIRKYWVPLFEQYGVRVAFEHDHHVYKRSARIYREARDDASALST